MNNNLSPSLSLPSVILLFDLSALVVGKNREWQEFTKVGHCFVPQVVLEEIKAFASQAADPEHEQTAREFCRFYPKSGWRTSTISAFHPSLKSAAGAAISKKARLSLAVAEAAYGVAQHRPRELVVLIANDQPLLQRIRALNLPNLCGIPVSALLLWSRTQRRPMVVNQHFRQLVGGAAQSQSAVVRPSQPVIASRPVVRSTTPTATPIASTRSTNTRSTSATIAPTRSTASVRTQSQVTYSLAQFISQFVSIVLALSVMVFIISIAWRTFHPSSFNRFWQQTVRPVLSGEPTAKPKSTGK